MKSMEKIENLVLQANSFSCFNPMQQKALQKDWKLKNLVVSSPTASGKTIVAEVLALHSILEKKRKVVYTCPLRALASEHFQDFKKKYSQELGLRIALSTGDFDSSSSYLQNYDLVFCTTEKLDSLLRHSAEWLSGIGLLVLDEVHEIDSSRGPCIEIITSKLRLLNPKLQVLALSATIPNCKEIAEWLNAELVQSDFRPVKLKEGVFVNSELKFSKEIEEINNSCSDVLNSLIEDTLQRKKEEALVFANTRKNAENTARKLSKLTQKILSEKEKQFLVKKSLEVLNVLEQPTEQCKLLSSLIQKGIAFHHAGLLAKQRSIIEELFRSNNLKVLTATSTLSLGVNLPAFRVIIPTLYRYLDWGFERISVREYKQLCGRAGRPAFDSFGESILIAKSELEAVELQENFINGEIEEVTSRLGIEPILRTHLLAAIATDFAFDLKSLEDFLSKTFFAFQFKNLSKLFEKISGILKELEEMQFLQSDEKRFKATKLGKRVSELYLDPLTAFQIIQSLKKRNVSLLSYLFSLSNAFELQPLPAVQKARQAELLEVLQERKLELSENVDVLMFEDPLLLKKFSTALMLEEWLSEKPEQDLMKEYNVQPGILHSKLQIFDWLAYSAFELSRLLELSEHLTPLAKLRKRLKYGIKEELIALCEVRGVGRVRARKLFNNSIQTVSELKKASLHELSQILGFAVALQLKKNFGQLQELSEQEKTMLKNEFSKTQGQSSLKEF